MLRIRGQRVDGNGKNIPFKILEIVLKGIYFSVSHHAHCPEIAALRYD